MLTRILLTGLTLFIIFIGLFMAATNWPVTHFDLRQTCDIETQTCWTVTAATYKTGSEVGVLFGVFLAVFGLAIIIIILANYIKYMFTIMRKRVQKLFSK